MITEERADRVWEKVVEMFDRRILGMCPFCGEPVDANEFRDEQSRREYKISGLCQKCQDEFFGC